MNLVTKEINNKEAWESFLLKCGEKTFLDSWNWGEFQKKEGNKIWRLGVYDSEQLVGVALLVKIEAKRGTFLFIPHGPITKNQESGIKNQILEVLVNWLKEIASEEGASFIRVAPTWERSQENKKIFKDLGFKEAPIHIHPEVTWEIDTSPSEEELLMKFRKTTRYLIRQAEKNKEIEIIKSQNIDDLKTFNEIYQKTARRHHFVPFSLKYLENEFSSFRDDNQAVIFLGKYKEEVIASAVVIYWQKMAFYHQGASLSKYDSNKVPVSYFLQWEAIREAKKRSCNFYNFWGIAEEIKEKTDIKKSKHPWVGLTLFKMGFGGYRKEYVKTQDLPLSRKYHLTYVFEKVRKMKRGL